MNEELRNAIVNTLDFSKTSMCEFVSAIESYIASVGPDEALATYLQLASEGSVVECLIEFQRELGSAKMQEVVRRGWGQWEQSQRLMLAMAACEKMFLSVSQWVVLFDSPVAETYERHRIVAGLVVREGMSNKIALDLIQRIGDYTDSEKQKLLDSFRTKWCDVLRDRQASKSR